VIDRDTSVSGVGLSVLSGTAVSIWVGADTDPRTDTEAALQLEPDRPVVVGRSRGRSHVEYLDPAFRPTPTVPETGQSVLLTDGRGDDIYVSRGHFTLRAVAAGVVLVNGVPRRGGGVRPPVNGTWLVAPAARPLDPGEELLVERGTAVVIRLPNNCLIEIAAR
jgi:hypothetical protein